jgi:hypothetical protein
MVRVAQFLASGEDARVEASQLINARYDCAEGMVFSELTLSLGPRKL